MNINGNPIIFEINVVAYVRDIRTGWVVYSLINIENSTVVHLGFCRVTQLFTFPDFKGSVDQPLMVKTYGVFENKGLADRHTRQKANELGLTKMIQARNINSTHGQIRCVDTGEIFSTIAEVSRSHGVDAGALSKHLNKQPGFKTVKNKIYERVQHIPTPPPPTRVIWK